MTVKTSQQYLEQPSFRWSVVVPILNEMAALSTLVANIENVSADQIVIVDGGSDDGTFEWLQKNWCQSGAPTRHRQERSLITTAAGRARQMNAGANVCSTDVIVFLHADTVLPNNIYSELLKARENQSLWGRFDIEFSEDEHVSIAMRVIALFINWRSRLSGIATGDQAIFVDVNLFKMIGGYADIPLMEDIVISKQLKRNSKPYCSHNKVVTSPRRWIKKGIIRTVLLMWVFRFAFFLGVSAERLAKLYRHVR